MGKLSRTVLRGGEGSDSRTLPATWEKGIQFMAEYKDKEFVSSLVKEIPKVPRGKGQHPKTRYNPRPRNEVIPYWLLDRSISLSSDLSVSVSLYGGEMQYRSQ
jgi:hypothetical protein